MSLEMYQSERHGIVPDDMPRIFLENAPATLYSDRPFWVRDMRISVPTSHCFVVKMNNLVRFSLGLVQSRLLR